MNSDEMQAMIRQEVQNALSGLMKPEDKSQSGLNTIFEMSVLQLQNQLSVLEARLAGAEEDAWADSDQVLPDFMGLVPQAPPEPFEIVLLGGLDFRVERGNVYGLTFDMIDNGYLDFDVIDVNSASMGTTAAHATLDTFIYLEITYGYSTEPTLPIESDHGIIYISSVGLVATTTYPAADANPDVFDSASSGTFRIYIGAVIPSGGELSILAQNHTGHWWDSISGTMYYVPPP